MSPSFTKAFVFSCLHRSSSAVSCDPLTFAAFLPSLILFHFHLFLFISLFSSHSFSRSHACLSSREWLHIFARWVFHALICMVLTLSVEKKNESNNQPLKLQLLTPTNLWLHQVWTSVQCYPKWSSFSFMLVMGMLCVYFLLPILLLVSFVAAFNYPAYNWQWCVMRFQLI